MKSTLLVASQPTKQQLLDYTNALIILNSYAYAITNQGLPALKFPPSHYSDFIIEFVKAKSHALNWTENIFPTMLQLPVTIEQQTANYFSMEQGMITVYLNALIADPSNTSAKNNLATSLSAIQDQINDQITIIKSIQSNLSTFTSEIYTDAQALTNLAAEALQDAGADQQIIDSLLSSIKQLNDQIATAQTMLTYAEVGMGLSIFVALIGIVCCIIPGAQLAGAGLIVIAVAGEATSIAFTVIENKNITALQQSIDDDQKEISDLKQDIIMLNAVNSSFNNLYNANLKAQSALTTIGAMWNNLYVLIGDISAELTDTNNDTTAAHYQQALNDFKQAEDNWAEVVTFATALSGIKFNWQDAQGNWIAYSSQTPPPDGGHLFNIPSNIKAA